MELTYEKIKSLIKKEELQAGNQIHLEFCADNQQDPISTVAVIIPDQTEMKKNMTKQVVKETVKSTLITQLLNLIGIRGVGRSLARSATDKIAGKQDMSSGMMKTEITEEKKQKAIVDAFKPFASMYQFNEQNSEWEYISPSV